MAKKRVFLLAAITLACVTVLSPGVLRAQEGEAAPQESTDDEPAWLHYERGMSLFRQREFGRAVQEFRAAIEKGNPYPEAQAGIGMVFQAEGSTDLAERQYREALSDERFFRNPEYRYTIRYRLAELYRLEQRRSQYQEALKAIVADDPIFASSENESLRESYERTLLEDGFNRLLVLYRQEEARFALRAHRDLGTFLVRTGRYTEALQHLTFAALKTATTLVQEMREERFEYEFQSLSALLDDLQGIDRLEDYVDYTSLHEILYYLAAAVYGTQPSSATWQELWGSLAEHEPAGQWADRARSQLQNPELEPLLNYQLGVRDIWIGSSFGGRDSTISRISMSSFPGTSSSSFPASAARESRLSPSTPSTRKDSGAT